MVEVFCDEFYFSVKYSFPCKNLWRFFFPFKLTDFKKMSYDVYINVFKCFFCWNKRIDRSFCRFYVDWKWVNILGTALSAAKSNTVIQCHSTIRAYTKTSVFHYFFIKSFLIFWIKSAKTWFLFIVVTVYFHL